MKELGLNKAELKELKGYHTAHEIVSQPLLWEEIYDDVLRGKEKILGFIRSIHNIENCDIILTGAGTSCFVGEVLESAFMQYLSPFSRTVATTTLVTHPEVYFSSPRTTVLVSFARSGNSPESRASLALANKHCGEVRHLVITCNAQGEMIKELDLEKDFLFLLPEQANDKGLAMTGSFTGMLLAGYLMARIEDVESLSDEFQLAKVYGQRLISTSEVMCKKLAELDFSRAIFLGSGPLLGVARESHLKVQELSNGSVMCNFDSYLGLRHGPKVVVDSQTLVVFLLSNDEYVRKYEVDLIKDMVTESLGLKKIIISERPCPELDVDYVINMGEEGTALDPYFLAMVNVLPAQILGFFKSIQLGYSPDSPSEKGTISRVVQGVRIYEYTHQMRKKKDCEINEYD
ncbi:SIS domain-containing protein [Membranihabitans marinus]|uniref:SIS domain-containing protein n=1 Tax=Membranihabitans marinus TaxID=1227546 RepID=UPI001F011F89|nr:SIS domain-containing protein [Membranihabitans marinus]